MKTTETHATKIWEPVKRFEPRLRALYRRFFADLTHRYGLDDVVQIASMTVLDLIEQGLDPASPDWEPVALTAIKRDLLNLIAHEKAGCRDYSRDTEMTPEGEDNRISAPSFGYEAKHHWPDVPAVDPQEQAASYELFERVQSRLSEFGSRLFEALTTKQAEIDSLFEEYKAVKFSKGQTTRKDRRTFLGYPWVIWARYLGTNIAEIKGAAKEIRSVVTALRV